MSEELHRYDIHYFESFSTKQLEQMIRDDCYGIAPLDDESIEHILCVLQKRSPNPEGCNSVDTEKEWKRFLKHYAPKTGQIDRILPEEALPAPNRTPKKLWLRVASIAAAVCIVMFCFATVPVHGSENLFTAIGRWSNDLFSMHYSSNSHFSSNLDLVKLKELSDVAFNSAQIIPSWLPDGFSVHDYSVLGNNNSFNLSAIFLSGERILQFNATEASGRNLTDYTKDEGTAEMFVSNGICHYLISNNGKLVAIWANDGVECSIAGDVSTDELKKIITSIYERFEQS